MSSQSQLCQQQFLMGGESTQVGTQEEGEERVAQWSARGAYVIGEWPLALTL